jgi:hypothetical protein
MTEQTKGRLSIVMVVGEDHGRPPRALASAIEHREASPAWEIIVVQRGERPLVAPPEPTGTARASTIFLHQPGVSLNQARNEAVRQATGEIILFVDDAGRLDKNLVREHTRAHQTSQAAVTGELVWETGLAMTPLMRLADMHERQRRAAQQSPEDAPFASLHLGNASIERRALLSAGLFDEMLPLTGWEDIDLAYRLRLAGVRFLYRPSAIVYRSQPLTLEQYLADARRRGLETVQGWRKHPELGRLTGLYRLIGESDELDFYSVAGRYAWLVGAAQALERGGLSSAGLDTITRQVRPAIDLSVWRDDYMVEQERRCHEVIHRQAQTIENQRRQLESLTAKTAEVEAQWQKDLAWASELESKLAEQSAWATQLTSRLSELTRGNLIQQLLTVLRRARG